MRSVIADAGSMAAWVVALLLRQTLCRTLRRPRLCIVQTQPDCIGSVVHFPVRHCLSDPENAPFAAIKRSFGGRFRLCQPHFGRRIQCIERHFDYYPAGHARFKTDLPDTEEWRQSYTLPFFVSLSEAVMNHSGGTAETPEDD